MNFLQHVLTQQKTLLSSISPKAYTYKCAVMGSSVGMHLRHSLDHIMVALSLAETATTCNPIVTRSYDHRDRGTTVETNTDDALGLIERLESQFYHISQNSKEVENLNVKVAFMVNDKGEEEAFQSTLGREIMFSGHHALHHHALITVMSNLRRNNEKFAEFKFDVPESFGSAPSTINAE